MLRHEDLHKFVLLNKSTLDNKLPFEFFQAFLNLSTNWVKLATCEKIRAGYMNHTHKKMLTLMPTTQNFNCTTSPPSFNSKCRPINISNFPPLGVVGSETEHQVDSNLNFIM